MKLSRLFSALFYALGTVLLAGGILMCFVFQGKSSRQEPVPQEASVLAERFCGAVNSGDLASAQAMIYGTPELGLSGSLEDSQADRVWQAFRQSLSCQRVGSAEFSGGELRQEIAVTALDVESLLASLPDLARSELEGRTDTEDLYDESGVLLPQARAALLEAALTAALSQAGTVSRNGILTICQVDGQWWAVPDEALLLALSGGGK